MKIVWFLLRLLLGAGMLTYLLYEHELPFGEVADKIWRLPALFLGGALALELGGRAISAFRWSRITHIAGRPASYQQTLPLFFSGLFFNICLPTSIGGDVFKTVALGRSLGSKSAALASIFMDRNVGMAALLTLGFCSSLLFPSTLQITMFSQKYEYPIWWFFLPVMLGYLLANVLLFHHRTFEWFDRGILQRAPEKFRVKLEKLHTNLAAYRKPLLTYWEVYLLSLAYQVSECACVWVLCLGLGLKLPFWVFGALVTLQAIGGLLPITINNIGIREFFFCAVLLGQVSVLHLPPEQVKDLAMAASLTYFGLIVFSGLVGGGVYLISGMPRPTACELEDGPPSTPALPSLQPANTPHALPPNLQEPARNQPAR